MKKKVNFLMATLIMLCLVACNGSSPQNTTSNVGNGSNNKMVTGNIAIEPTAETDAKITASPTEETTGASGSETAESMPEQSATSVPIEEPITEVTPEPTKEAVVYPGIDMESDLLGTRWIKTFIGVIAEPKIVVYSDETGKKEIVEQDDIVKIDPYTDTIAVYLPEGYVYSSQTGIKNDEQLATEYYHVFLLNAEEIKEAGPQLAVIYVKYEGEEIGLKFALVPEE